MSADTSRVLYCKSCGRRAEVPLPDSQGHPYGWYSLSVGVPPEYNSRTRTRKGYRWVGTYCSADCLGNGIGDICADDVRERHAYEHE